MNAPAHRSMAMALPVQNPQPVPPGGAALLPPGVASGPILPAESTPSGPPPDRGLIAARPAPPAEAGDRAAV